MNRMDETTRERLVVHHFAGSRGPLFGAFHPGDRAARTAVLICSPEGPELQRGHRVLRLLVVTPDMHRVHHSIRPDETNSNFGFNVPWWDRLLGTYRAQPVDAHEGMTIGIEQFRQARELWLDRMLIQPLRDPASGYPINRR